VRLACQEHILPGDDILEKWEFAASAGFDGIELRGTEDWRERLDELRAVREQGAVFSSVCLISDRFIGDFDADRRREAVEHMKHLLSGIAELGGTGAVTPAAYGLASRRLPPSRCPARRKKTGACCSTRWRNSASSPRGREPSCCSSRSTAMRTTC
jgi:sugar phosphate isomerase/epimerase